jgi:hypothetical protein
MILMLEDDPERLTRFAQVLNDIDSNLPFQFWRDAPSMMREAGPLLTDSLLISLDHDLIPDSGEPDPGDGYMLAQWLTKQPIVKPVILHSSNGDRSSWMAGEFDLAGWRYWRVIPYGEDWIENDWHRVVRRLIARSKRNSVST